MYIRQLRAAVIQIPKCGSQTLREVIEAEHGKCALAGHLTQAEVEAHCRKQGWPLDTVFALIRDPWERFVSGMNFVYGDTDTTLKQAMDEYLSGNLRRSGNVVTAPQSSFLGGEIKPVLLPFEDMDTLLDTLGCPLRVHKNKSKKRWNKSHFRKWEDLIDIRLSADDEVRSRALGT